MAADRRTFSRLESTRREQTPQALARLAAIGLFISLWTILWLGRIPMPLPFLLVLLAEAVFILVYWRTVFLLPNVRSVLAAQYCMLGGEILFHTTMVYFLGGISWLGAFAYVFGLIFTNTFLDMRRGLVYTAAASLAFSSLLLLEATGTIPHYVYLEQGALRYSDTQFVITTVIGGCGVFFSIYVWVNWVGRQLRQERDTAVHVQEELLHARADLQHTNEALEDRVTLRTAELVKANSALRESQERLATVTANAPVILLALNLDGVFTVLEGRALASLGMDKESLIGHSVFDVFRDAPEVLKTVRQAFAGEPAITLLRSGRMWLETQFIPVRNESGEIIGVTGVGTDITERMNAEVLLTEQRSLMEMISIGKPLQDILDATVRLIEEQSPGTLCSVCLVDEDARVLRTVAAPSLPETYLEALAAGIPIGAGSASCGTAAERREPVVVRDIASDPLWAEYAELALKHDLRACWSTPIISTSNAVLGTFAMYSRTPGGPSAEQRRLVDIAARIASIAIERTRAEEALQFTQASVDRAADAVFWLKSDARIVYVNDAACESLGYSREELLTMTVPDIDAETTVSTWQEHWQDVKRRQSFTIESEHLTKDGRTFPVEIAVNYLEFNGIEYNCAFVRDVTERKQTQEALQESEGRFHRLAENAKDVIFRYRISPTPGVEYISPAAEAFVGYSQEEFYADPQLGMSVVHPDDAGALGELITGDLAAPARIRWLHKNGETVWTETHAVAIRDDGGNIVAIEGIARDVTERVRSEKALQESESKFRTTAETIAAAVFIFQDGFIRYANPAMEAMTGYTNDELLNMRIEELIHADFHHEANERGPVPEQGRIERQQYEIKVVTRSGEERWVDFTGSVLEFQGVPAVLGTAFDVTDRRRAEAALKDLADHDPLTGLYNRRAGLSALDRKLTDAKEAGEQLAVLVLDLDKFKSINDSFSHETGDAALVRFGNVLSDLIGDNDVVCRLGGDEFEIALAGASLEDAYEFASKLRHALCDALKDTTGEAVPAFTVSIGIACFPNDGKGMRTLGRRSDQAMYAAKADGGDGAAAWRALPRRRAA